MIHRTLHAALATALVLLLAACGDNGGSSSSSTAAGPWGAGLDATQARIETSHGGFTVELDHAAAPRTVQAFLGLAAGKGSYTDNRTGTAVTVTKPFYDGLTFHRVVKDFMLQGGCPRGNGSGDPGFQFDDEMDAVALGLDKKFVAAGGQPHMWIRQMGPQYWQQSVLWPVVKQQNIDPKELNASRDVQSRLLKHMESLSLQALYELQGFRYERGLPSKPPKRGFLAMANSGPNTNGSQFFVIVGNPDYLTGRHTVFGRVVEGMEVVDKIAAVPVARGINKPLKPVRIVSIRPVP